MLVRLEVYLSHQSLKSKRWVCCRRSVLETQLEVFALVLSNALFTSKTHLTVANNSCGVVDGIAWQVAVNMKLKTQ